MGLWLIQDPSNFRQGTLLSEEIWRPKRKKDLSYKTLKSGLWTQKRDSALGRTNRPAVAVPTHLAVEAVRVGLRHCRRGDSRVRCGRCFLPNQNGPGSGWGHSLQPSEEQSSLRSFLLHSIFVFCFVAFCLGFCKRAFPAPPQTS